MAKYFYINISLSVFTFTRQSNLLLGYSRFNSWND